MAKILLVEDDNNLREIFELRLQADGYETVVASDGEEALVIALREKPDLIIADVMMPKMSGFEMVENLRAAPDMSNVKIVMMTALGQAEDRARGESLGVVKYLVKSQVTLEDFARVIKEVLASSASSTDDNLEKHEDNKSSTDKQEGDKKMQDDNDLAVTTQSDNTSPAPTANPISADEPPVSSSNPQMTTADAQSAVQKQVDDFASDMNSPTAGSTTTSDIPVATPPDDPTPPTDPLPTPPPSPDGPTTT